MSEEFSYREPDPNKKTAVQVWEERYKPDHYVFGKEPVLCLKNHVELLRKGKALDVAMGEGRNSVYLAQQGFTVEGVDCSARAIEKAKKLATEKGVTLDAKSQNLDFFLMPLMKYDTILMTYFRPLPRFFSEIRRGLVHGGTFLLEAYTVEHFKNQPSPNPLLDFEDCYKPNEVLVQLRDHFQVLLYKEYAEGGSHTVSVVARKTSK